MNSITLQNLRQCTKESPKEPGWYLVVRLNTDGSLSEVSPIHYENGWNCWTDKDGEYHCEWVIVFEDGLDYWTNEVDYETDKDEGYTWCFSYDDR